MSPRLQRLRKVMPWLIGVAIVGFVAKNVPFAQFRDSVQNGPNLQLACVELLITTFVLFTDSLGTWLGLVALGIRWAFKKTVAVRGVTYLLFLINYAVGQGGFGYYIYRGGETAPRSFGATLFLIGTNLATLLVLAFTVWVIAGASDANPRMWWTLVIGTAGLGVYLVIIALRPGIVAGRAVLAPLFDAGLRGHGLAILGRVPHVIAVVLAHWVAMRVWGIEVPFVAAATLMPAVALAAVLPISPAGLGTTLAALVYFFSDYAVGATADERSGAILAFGIVHFVYGVAAALLVGAACLVYAKRSGALPSDPPAEPAK